MADAPTPVTPRVRQLCLDPPCRTDRSADSGYGSLETSPTRLPPRRRLDRKSLFLTARLDGLSLNSYDGNSSEESESDKANHDEPKPGASNIPSVACEKFATLPRVSRRRISRTDSYNLIPDRKNIHQRHGSDNTGITSSRVSSLKVLDRFVPLRDHETPGSSKLRTTKTLEELTPSERLVRHNQDAPDPFFFKRRALPPSPTEARKTRRSSQNRTVLDPTTGSRAERRVVSSPYLQMAPALCLPILSRPPNLHGHYLEQNIFPQDAANQESRRATASGP